MDGRRLLAFCSNDYLGLAAHPEVTRALIAGAERWGCGAGSAHLVNGHTTAHHALEEDLAEFSERHRDRLYRMARAWLGDGMLAQDAVQEAFVRSYTGLGQFRFRATDQPHQVDRAVLGDHLDTGRVHVLLR